MGVERMRSRFAGGIVFALVIVLGWVGRLGAQSGGGATYYEFGTVVGILRQSIDIQAFDEQRHRMVRHSFRLASESHVDVARTGDAVEVIYTVDGAAWTLRRMMVLEGGIPKAGPPAVGAAESAPPAVAAAPAKRNDAKARSNGVRPVTIPAPAPKAVGEARPVDLSSKAVAKTPAVTAVPLGIAGGYSKPAPVPVTKAVTREIPSEECNRSRSDWPGEPLRIAVLDFRYPKEREEAHDIGKTGGGAGTAVADLVFSRLEDLHQFEMVRGDRRRLDRADIAGAAKLGRELGADAVLEGTFEPTDADVAPDGTETKPRGYELRAGLVETCTGQVLMKLSSVACVGGAANGAECQHFGVTAKEAEDPDEHAHAFDPSIRALLYPLEHNATPAGLPNAVGVVASSGRGGVALRLNGGARVQVGEQVAVHAIRLAKNPQTYTLQNLSDQEIGRVTIRSVQGGTASGSFIGDVPPQVGDAVAAVTE